MARLIEDFDYEQTGFRRYRLLKNLIIDTGILPPDGKEIRTKFGHLAANGVLTLFAGYRWDGATGAIDTPSIMRASAVHDWFCTHVVTRKLPTSYRRKGDDLFYLICIEDEMPRVRAEYAHTAVVGYGKLVVHMLEG